MATTSKHDTHLDEALINALVAGRNQTQAAQAVQCSVSHVSRRMADPAFRNRVDALRTQVRQQVVDLTAHLSVDALVFLGQVMRNEQAPLARRLEAAKAIISTTIRVSAPDGGPVQVEVTDLAEQRQMVLSSLDRRADELGVPRSVSLN